MEVPEKFLECQTLSGHGFYSKQIVHCYKPTKYHNITQRENKITYHHRHTSRQQEGLRASLIDYTLYMTSIGQRGGPTTEKKRGHLRGRCLGAGGGGAGNDQPSLSIDTKVSTKAGEQRSSTLTQCPAFLGALGLDVGRWRAHKGTQGNVWVPGLLVREAPGAALVLCVNCVSDQRESTRTYDVGGAGQALVAVVAVAAEAGEESAETRAKRHFDDCRKEERKAREDIRKLVIPGSCAQPRLIVKGLVHVWARSTSFQ